jgi:hypothetical protein
LRECGDIVIEQARVRRDVRDKAPLLTPRSSAVADRKIPLSQAKVNHRLGWIGIMANKVSADKDGVPPVSRGSGDWGCKDHTLGGGGQASTE